MMLLFYKCSHCFCGRSESSFPQKSYALWSKWICLVSLYLKWVKVYVELIKVRCGLNPLKLRLITNYACSLKRQISEDFFPNPISCWRNHNLYYEYMCGIDYDMVRPILCMTRATILLGMMVKYELDKSVQHSRIKITPFQVDGLNSYYKSKLVLGCCQV